MAIECVDLQELVRQFSLVQACDEIKGGRLRLATPFSYPDGSQIDLFLSREADVDGVYKLSDLGQTTAYLLDMMVKPWATAKRRQMDADVCRSLGVDHDGGEYLIKILQSEFSALPDALVRLAQVCIRISDLAFTQRLRAGSIFDEDFEEFVGGIQLSYETGVKIQGAFGRQIEIDLQVRGHRTVSLVQTLSTGNSNTGHVLANEVFRKWYDIAQVPQPYQRITVYDATNDIFREDDILRIGTLSSTFGFPAQQDALSQVLAA